MLPSPRRRILAGLACAIALGTAALVAGSSGGRPSDAQAATILDQLVTCNGVQIPIVGAVSLGNVLAGLPLTSATELCDPIAPGEPASIPYTSVIYGDCVATSEEGCGPPLEVQSWPECHRNLSRYTMTEADGSQGSYPHVMRTLTGAPQIPIAIFDDGTRTEVYTGATSIVVFAEDPALMQQALNAVSAVEAPINTATATRLMAAAQGGGSC
jgi:hypothetical protein